MQPTTIQPQQVDPSTFGQYSDWAKQNMSNGVSADQLQQTLQQNKISVTPQAQTNQPSWWEKLLPTAGGILGGIAGTFVSPIIGSAAGAGIGGAAGQALENKLSGTKTNVLETGAMNAAGGLLGGGLGAGLAKLSSKFLAPAAEAGAAKLVAGQAPGVTKNLGTYVSKDLGMSSLPKAGQVADVMTGGTSQAANIDGQAELTKLVENGLRNSQLKTVDLSMFQPATTTGKNAVLSQTSATDNIVENAIKSNNLLGTPSGAAVRTNVGGVVKSFSNPGSVDVLDALGAQRDIAGLAGKEYDLFQSTRDPLALNRYNALQQINQSLKSKLQLDQMRISPDDQAQLASNLQRYIAPIDRNAADGISKQIANLKSADGGAPTLADIRNLESNFVQIKGALKDASKAADKNYGTSTGNIARQTLPIVGAVIGGPKNALGTLAGLATSSPAADRYGAAILQKAAAGANGKVIQKVLPLATRSTAIAAANVPNIASSTQPTGVQSNSAIPTGLGTQGTTMTPQTGPDANPYNQAVNLALTQMALDPAQLGGNASSVLNTALPQLQKNAAATSAIQSALNAYQNAGAGQGMLGGAISRIGGLIPGTAANTYSTQQQAAISALATALGISPQAAAGLLPQLMQAQPQAAQTTTGLQSVLGSLTGAAQ